MAERYNPFGLDYLRGPAEAPAFTVDSRWPDQPSVADAFQMGHLAGTDQYAPQTYAPFDAYDRAQQQTHRDERQQQAMQRPGAQKLFIQKSTRHAIGTAGALHDAAARCRFAAHE